MSFQWASRTGVLRHLRLGNAFSRPTRVISAQNQLRHVCLATKPQLRIPSTGFKSALLSQQSHGFATTAESAKGSPKKKGSSAKSKSAKSKKPKAKKPGRKPTKKPSEKTLARRQADKQRAEVKALKTAALKEPKALNDRSWPLAVAAKMTELKGQFPAQKDLFVEASKAAKNMTPEELARYKTQAEENKTANEAAYKSWVGSFTPGQIREANLARRALVRLGRMKTPRLIKDDRLPKLPKTAFLIFVTQRMATGDFKHLRVAESVPAIAQEWKSMNETEKQPYYDLHQRDRERYAREHMAVFGAAPRTYEGENAPGAKAAE